MKHSVKPLLILFFLCCSLSVLHADVYLLTNYNGEGHSILIVTGIVNGKEEVIADLSKYPGPDKDYKLVDGVICKITKLPGLDDKYASRFDIQKRQGYDGYSGVKLSVEAGSNLEKRIIEKIEDYETGIDDWWLWSNCGQATYGVLRDAGYFDETTIASIEEIYGTSEFAESPLRTSTAVALQEAKNAAIKRKEQEEKELQAQQDVIENNENDDRRDTTPEGDDVVNDTGDTNQPEGDEVVINNDSGSDNADTSDEYDSSISLVDVANDVADHFAIVLPNIPHYRLLWIFSGESLGSSVKSLWDGFSNKSGRGNVSELKSNLKLIKGIGND